MPSLAPCLRTASCSAGGGRLACHCRRHARQRGQRLGQQLGGWLAWRSAKPASLSLIRRYPWFAATPCLRINAGCQILQQCWADEWEQCLGVGWAGCLPKGWPGVEGKEGENAASNGLGRLRAPTHKAWKTRLGGGLRRRHRQREGACARGAHEVGYLPLVFCKNMAGGSMLGKVFQQRRASGCGP